MYKCLIQKDIGQFPLLLSKDISADNIEPVIDIKAASLNHRDLWITKGRYAKIRLPVVLGSDGAGLYEGMRVLTQPGMGWGNNNESWQGTNYEIIGMPNDGTFAEKFCIPRRYIHAIPDHLSYEEAAALPLAGLTGWRALMSKGCPVAGEKVLINGIGGGVALMVFIFAKALGLEIYVTSSEKEKIAKAINMGAKGGVLYSQENHLKILKEMSGGIDIIIDSAGGDSFSGFLDLCNPGARIVMYGGTLGNINNLSPQKIFWKQVSIYGTTMGSDQEFSEMLNFVDINQVRPVIDSVYDLNDYKKAFERMESGKQFGKILIRIAD